MSCWRAGPPPNPSRRTPADDVRRATARSRGPIRSASSFITFFVAAIAVAIMTIGALCEVVSSVGVERRVTGRAPERSSKVIPASERAVHYVSEPFGRSA